MVELEGIKYLGELLLESLQWAPEIARLILVCLVGP